MIKVDELREFRPGVRYKDGDGITLQSIQTVLQEEAQNMEVPVTFRSDEVKSGGFLNSSFENCLVMYHPEHPDDYFKICIRVAHQGNYAFVSINDFGQSKQVGKANRAEFAKQDRQGKTMSYKVGSMLSQGIMNIGMNKQKLEEEQMYYSCLWDLLDEVFS